MKTKVFTAGVHFIVLLLLNLMQRLRKGGISGQAQLNLFVSYSHTSQVVLQACLKSVRQFIVIVVQTASQILSRPNVFWCAISPRLWNHKQQKPKIKPKWRGCFAKLNRFVKQLYTSPHSPSGYDIIQKIQLLSIEK